MDMRRIAICSLPGCTVFFHISWTARFLGEKEVTEHKMYVLIFPTTFVGIFFILRRIERDRIIDVFCVHVKCLLYLMRVEFLDRFLKKMLLAFREHPRSGSRVLCGRTDRRNTHRRTMMTKLLVDLRSFTNAPKKCNSVSVRDFSLHLVDSLSLFCHPKQMSWTTVLRSFAGYEPRCGKDIIPAGCGRKRMWPLSSSLLMLPDGCIAVLLSHVLWYLG